MLGDHVRTSMRSASESTVLRSTARFPFPSRSRSRLAATLSSGEDTEEPPELEPLSTCLLSPKPLMNPSSTASRAAAPRGTVSAAEIAKIEADEPEGGQIRDHDSSSNPTKLCEKKSNGN
jgi:hypothetical protein